MRNALRMSHLSAPEVKVKVKVKVKSVAMLGV